MKDLGNENEDLENQLKKFVKQLENKEKNCHEDTY